MIKDAKTITCEYGFFNHTVKYRGHFVTGAGTMNTEGPRRQSNLKFHKEQAALKKERLLKGNFSRDERSRIKAIDKLVDLIEAAEYALGVIETFSMNSGNALLDVDRKRIKAAIENAKGDS